MPSQRIIDSLVGLFLLLSIGALILLAFKVSGLTGLFSDPGYLVQATFEDIGGLKARAPIKISGVPIGSVQRIDLDPITLKAIVTFHIMDQYPNIPNDSTARILTTGLLGDNYIAITPMYSKIFLKNGDHLSFTTSAMVLEKLLGQFLFNIKK